jgi:CubicO group peptidase (beta-lactamase class C family)
MANWMRLYRFFLAVQVVLLSSFITGCGAVQTTSTPAQTITTATSPTIPEADYWPAQDWRTSTPEAQGMDSMQMVKLFEHIQEKKIDLHSLLIIRNGYIVAEANYAPFQANSPHDIASIQKSVVSALVGIAIDKGYLQGVQQKMVDLFPGRAIANNDARKQSITIEHMLTMSPGLAWDEWRPEDNQNSSTQMAHSPDGLQFVLDRPVVNDPGSRWNYNSGLPDLLAEAVRQTSGMSLKEFTGKYLFDPLGIHSAVWRIDSGGGFAIAMTPRDMARMGYLYLKQGAWVGKTVISPGWIKASTANHISTGIEGNNYGYYWWEPPLGGFSANGNGGQRIFVIPDQQMVVILVAGMTYPDMEIVPEELVSQYILPAVKSQAALPPNPQADDRLSALIKNAAQPQPKDIPPLPELAETVSGKIFMLKPNSIGLQAAGLSFKGQEAAVHLTFAGKSQDMVAGLDNVFRMNKVETAGPIYGWMALRGSWTTGNAFTLDMLMSGVSRRFSFVFSGDQVTVWYHGSRGENEPIQGIPQK